MRIMFKPESRTLWGFNQLLISQSKIFTTKDTSFSLDNSPVEDEIDEENDVEMKRTMWLVLRKTKPTNETLKLFYAETVSYPLRLKDIIKFGRVNFKVSALSSSRLEEDIQGSYEQ